MKEETKSTKRSNHLWSLIIRWIMTLKRDWEMRELLGRGRRRLGCWGRSGPPARTGKVWCSTEIKITTVCEWFYTESQVTSYLVFSLMNRMYLLLAEVAQRAKVSLCRPPRAQAPHRCGATTLSWWWITYWLDLLRLEWGVKGSHKNRLGLNY